MSKFLKTAKHLFYQFDYYLRWNNVIWPLIRWKLVHICKARWLQHTKPRKVGWFNLIKSCYSIFSIGVIILTYFFYLKKDHVTFFSWKNCSSHHIHLSVWNNYTVVQGRRKCPNARTRFEGNFGWSGEILINNLKTSEKF